MIAAGMGYALTMALLLTMAALATERVLALHRWPRRYLWAAAMTASLAVPCTALMFAAQAPEFQATPTESAPDIQPPVAMDVLGAYRSIVEPELRTGSAWLKLDSVLLGLWMVSSTILLVLFASAAVRFQRLACSWPATQVNGSTVWIANGIGPAVFGLLRPRIILPSWLLEAPSSMRTTVIAHEQAHIAARDPLLLLLAQLTVVLLPWNVPLWWQLRRLRFAIEVDCDARVLQTGLDPRAYGETLLTIGQHRSRMPLGAVAMTEPVSQLERRIQIMMLGKSRYRALIGGAFLVLGVAFVACAAQLDAPSAPSTGELRVPPPSMHDIKWAAVDESLQDGLQKRYPQLWHDDYEGMPVVEVLFKDGGTIEHSELRMANELPNTLVYSLDQFARFGVKAEELAYVTSRILRSPATGKKIFVIFGERKNANGTYAYLDKIGAMNRTAIDRAIIDRYFPDVLKGTAPPGQLWVLLDNEGQLLRTGREALNPQAGASGISSSDVQRALEIRFPRIRVHRATMSAVLNSDRQPMSDRNGEPITLNYFWLEKGAQLTQSIESGSACPATEPIQASPPPDPSADPFPHGPWYVNADRTIWAGWDAARMKASERGNKVLWIRPQGTELSVVGRRLDADAPAMLARLPCCYPTGFQASGLTFPTEGCWEVSAKAGNSTLTFITVVKPG